MSIGRAIGLVLQDVIDYVTPLLGGKEDAFAKNTAFNRSFGTASGTVTEGNDPRLSDARTPTAHTHTESEISDLDKYTQSEVDGLLGAKEDAFAKNTAFNLNLGTTAGTVTEGNDPRLADARTPTAHTHTESEISDLDKYTQSEVDGLLGGKEDAFAKNTAFNRSFGTASGTVTEGNDPRLSDARTPTAHTHTESEISDLDKYTQSEVDGLLGGKEDAFAKNTGFNLNLGTTAGTVAEGNDPRLADARTPTAHTHTESEISDLDKYTQSEVNGLLGGFVDLTSNQTIAGGKTFTSNPTISAAFPDLQLAATSYGSLTQSIDGNRRLYLSGREDHVQLARYSGAGSGTQSTTLSIYEDRIESSKKLKVIGQGSNNPEVEFSGGSYLWADGNGIKGHDGNGGRLFDFFAISSGSQFRLYGSNGVSARLQLEGSDGNWFGMKRAEGVGSGYTLIWPVARPSAGQVPRVASVSGGDVVMEFYTP